MAQQPIKYLDAINAALSAAVPSIGLIFAAYNLVREQFKRRADGQPEMTVAEQAQFMIDGGHDISATAQNWLAANGYDAEGNKVV